MPIFMGPLSFTLRVALRRLLRDARYARFAGSALYKPGAEFASPLDARVRSSVTRLSGKVAFITGGGTGIGRACALQFSREGARIAVAGQRPEPLAKVVAEIQ